MPDQPEYVSLRDLAALIHLDASNTRKFLVKHGFDTVRIRTPKSRSQLTLAVTAADAERLLEMRQSQGFVLSHRVPAINTQERGWFYLIQIIPEYNPNRVKLGFATDVQARLSAHRTSAPSAVLAKCWYCRISWEGTAIASITRQDCTRLTDEVYECTSLDEIIDRANAFFTLMPQTVSTTP